MFSSKSSLGSTTRFVTPYYFISKINLLSWAVGEIFKSAFTGRVAFGGFARATVAQAMRFGVARGIFSNKAGLDSASIAHVVAQTKHPVRQGTIAMIGVIIDTLIICSMIGHIVVKPYAWLFVIVAFLGAITKVPLRYLL